MFLTHPYRSKASLSQGISRVRLVTHSHRSSCRRGYDEHHLRSWDHPHEQLKRRGQSPPQRWQDGDEPQDEEPRMPWCGDIEDDGDAGLKERRMDGTIEFWGSYRRRGRRRRRRIFVRFRSHGRKRLWKMACGRAPTNGGRIAHLTSTDLGHLKQLIE